MSDVEVEGLDKAIRKFARMPNVAKKDMQEAIKTNADKIEQDQKSTVAVRSSATHDSISTKLEDDGLTADIRPRGTEGFRRHWIEFGTVHHPAQPFMIPSYEKNKNGYIQDVSKVLRDLK
ncbi:HK97-gp10 family putative phage morphogenesis protein [Oceanobacillus oncorhynchi]|uniref:HK97-gp10 family putative phage morphogenesis protein n=1 Tax=Oceanobacillus oncorhynchi TaxID=545501 RepID=UPI001868B63B|nr:HK97-gp10 family putative phage morphogenesis protein [Oceanobacillus oncorhynchi]